MDWGAFLCLVGLDRDTMGTLLGAAMSFQRPLRGGRAILGLQLKRDSRARARGRVR
jgi:hypothetical protein